MAVAVLAAGCSSGGDGGGRSPGPAGRATSTSTAVERPRGGSARVGVWGEPDPAAPTLGGAAVRALVLPQLFVARPDGRWAPALVAAGSDATAPDSRSATFRIAPGASWSDGSPVGAEDLRRSADPRFVAAVDGPAADGTVTVRFTQPLPGWRRLWSGTDAVTAPRPGVWGGPFVVAAHTPGLEVVLRGNDRWHGGRPFLDEVRLVLVPDPVTARQLLARGDLDVVMPPAATVRTAQLRAVPGVMVAVAERSGWWVGLFLRADRLARPQRASVAGAVDRAAFVGALLRGEAEVLDGFSAAGPGPWSGIGPGDPAPLRGVTVDVAGELEEPMTSLLQRSMQKRVHPAGGRLELRNAEADRVERWLVEGAYQAVVAMQVDGPEPCWTCRWAAVDEALARSADAGDGAAAQALQVKLRDDALLLPLWRSRTVVAWRKGLRGVTANGYALSGAWNAWEWWREQR